MASSPVGARALALLGLIQLPDDRLAREALGAE
jgi:hypothetical protein